MQTVIEPLRELYDVIIIDTPPSLGIPTVSALTASDSVLIPVTLQLLSAIGLKMLIKTIQKVQKHINPNLVIDGVLYKLIKNEVYIGKAVLNKLQVTEPGRNHTAPRPKDKWVIVPNAHEPLVSESYFQKAQLVLAKKIYFGKPEHILGNKVKCPACGHAMIRHTRQNPRFKCGTAKLTDH